MVAARASAVCASMSASRVWISAMRSGSVAVSASAMSAARSLSAAITVSSTLSAVAGASCATPPRRARRLTSMLPASSASCPWISLNNVVLPAPFLPTKPALAPSGRTSAAPSNRGRP